MRISQKADYAVRAAIDLGLHAPMGSPARVADIARRAHVPEKFLEAILVDLRKAGLVVSRRGPEGGHCLALRPSEITLGRIRAAVDGPLCLVEPARAGRTAVDLSLEKTWKEVEMAIGAVLEGVTVEDMCRRAQGHDGSSDFTI